MGKAKPEYYIVNDGSLNYDISKSPGESGSQNTDGPYTFTEAKIILNEKLRQDIQELQHQVKTFREMRKKDVDGGT